MPRRVTVTLTRPIWHAEVFDEAGRKSDCWFDGIVPFLQSHGQPEPMVAPQEGFDDPSIKRHYTIPAFLNCTESDFPDVEWVSAKTYLGSQKSESADYLIFQQSEGGAKVWIDSATRFPVLWQNGGETRRFQFFPPPTKSLVLPAEITQLSKAIKYLRKISTNVPARGS